MVRTTSQLHTDVVTLLAPATRDRYTYTGTGRTKTAVNNAGIDLHDGRVGQVAMNPPPPTGDGTAQPYMALATSGKTDQHQRLSAGASQALFTIRLTVAAGSPQGLRWALDKIDPLFARARLHESTGLLVPYFDPVQAIEDRDASPPRWYVHLRYSTTVH